MVPVPVHGGRLVVARARVRNVVVQLASLYLSVGGRITADDRQLLADLGGCLASAPLPFVAGGDFN
eukprot:6994368-Prorocentrum_lima.AAC.1